MVYAVGPAAGRLDDGIARSKHVERDRQGTARDTSPATKRSSKALTLEDQVVCTLAASQSPLGAPRLRSRVCLAAKSLDQAHPARERAYQTSGCERSRDATGARLVSGLGSGANYTASFAPELETVTPQPASRTGLCVAALHKGIR